MRRACGLFIITMLFISAAAQGQTATRAECRKRILVYLDVSGSMQPTSQSASAPFQQTVAAIESLLNEPGFIEGNDVLEVVRFGRTIQGQDRADSRDKMVSLLADLQANRLSDRATDFRPVFDSLAERLKDSGSFSSQVVLIGSDLVHEPRDGMPAEEAIADWSSAWASKSTERDAINGNSDRTAFVLFAPPASPRMRGVQTRVGEDLMKALRRAQTLSPGGAGTSLAEELTKGLLQLPKLTISRDSQNDSQIAFVVSNPNCVPLHVSGFSLQRILPDGNKSGPFAYKIDPAEGALGGSGTPEATRTFPQPLPSGSGWEDLSRLAGTVVTQEGISGSSEGTAGGWLKFRPVQGVVEGWLLRGPVLRLDFDVIGHSSPNSTYILSIRGSTDGSDASPLARAKFESPVDLDPVTPIRTRLVLPAARTLAGGLNEPKSYRLEIQGAHPIEEGQNQVEIAKDFAGGRSNLFLSLAGLASLLSVIFSGIRIRNVTERFPALQPLELKILYWTAMSVLALLPLAANFFHLNLLRHFSPEGVDRLAIVVAILALFFTLSFSLKTFQSTMFGQRVLTSTELPKLDQYLRQSRRAAWMPWFWAALVTVAFAGSWFILRPAVSERLARSEHPVHLRAISD